MRIALGPAAVLKYIVVAATLYYGTEWLGKPLTVLQSSLAALLVEIYLYASIMRGSFDATFAYATAARMQMEAAKAEAGKDNA